MEDLVIDPQTGFVVSRKHLYDACAMALNSRDPSTQNGAVLVTKDLREFTGCNRFALGLQTTDERLVDRDVKMRMTVHAEQTAIAAAHQACAPTPGAVLYCIWAPCTMCARSILEAGISHLVTLRRTYDMSPERWKGDIDQALAMLAEGGVGVTQFRGSVGFTKPLRLDFKEWLETE